MGIVTPYIKLHNKRSSHFQYLLACRVFLIELPVTVMTRMFKDNFKVNNDSFAALVNSNFSNVTGNFRSILMSKLSLFLK